MFKKYLIIILILASTLGITNALSIGNPTANTAIIPFAFNSPLSVSNNGLVSCTSCVGATPAGSNGNVQFNNNGNFGGSPGFTYNSFSNVIGIGHSGFLGGLNGAPTVTMSEGTYFDQHLLRWTAIENQESQIYEYDGTLSMATANNPIGSQVLFHDLVMANPDNLMQTTYGQGTVLLGDIGTAYNGFLFVLNQTNGTAYWNGGITAKTSINASNYFASGVAGTSGTYSIPNIFGGATQPTMGSTGGIATSIVPASGIKGITGELTSNDVAGKTGATPLLCRFTAPNTAMYEISFYATVNSISVDVLQAQTVFTDEQGNARTLTMFPMGTTAGGLSSTGAYGYPTFTIGAKAGTQINTNTILTTSVGTITWNGGCTISEVS